MSLPTAISIWMLSIAVVVLAVQALWFNKRIIKLESEVCRLNAEGKEMRRPRPTLVSDPSWRED